MSCEKLKERLLPLKREILAHPLYEAIKSVEDLAVFSESHVFAVWDFMTLLKSLQRRLTCVEIPWVPQGDRLSRRLINEIVLGEESDEHPNGGFSSHFELYLDAMQALGADREPIFSFIQDVQENISKALNRIQTRTGVVSFLQWTLHAAELPLHQTAAAFTFGREELVPDLFRSVVTTLDGNHPEKVSLFRKYLERHIDLDESSHSHLAFQMMDVLCGEDETKWKEAYVTASEALIQRKKLWDDILKTIQKRK